MANMECVAMYVHPLAEEVLQFYSIAERGHGDVIYTKWLEIHNSLPKGIYGFWESKSCHLNFNGPLSKTGM